MVPFNLQIELGARPVTFSVEQLDPLADMAGFMRYQVRTFRDCAIVFVNVEEEQMLPDDLIGFSEDEVFTPPEVNVIAQAIRQYHDSRNWNSDQMVFDF
ncbi:hypothetical protein [Mucilaginibacter agri]|uniref:Uncharacterized protein n=1 Tax=Mucilaginibacter agri TaxID=2695265 RepID=A0A965ZE40_9SPHI|nr:hypothetical protein [Mucilaginibacter agri]NCD68001.1 hypothetical protein [Mucilaginibacter agri]